MGNRHGARDDEFEWNLGVKRRLKRYLQSGLTHGEIALLLGTSRASISMAAKRFNLQMGVDQQREFQARQAWERAKTGKRSKERSWDSRLIETWEERKRRRARETKT